MIGLTVKNIFAELRGEKSAEQHSNLFHSVSTDIERIVSQVYSSPPGFWYDQAEDEWVIVLRGAATLEFAGGELVEMNAGDYLTIPRHVRHRVARTSEETVWLAVRIK